MFAFLHKMFKVQIRAGGKRPRFNDKMSTCISYSVQTPGEGGSYRKDKKSGFLRSAHTMKFGQNFLDIQYERVLSIFINNFGFQASSHLISGQTN